MFNLGFLYLDFIDACCDGFSARIEKYIQYFAIVFQGSAAKNYAGKTMYIVASLKKIWKPELKYVGAFKCFVDLIFNS